MGQSSGRSYESSNVDSHRLAASTNSSYDEDMEEIEEDENPDPHRVERSELVEGDHIYKWSSSTAYAHHGIYIGHNMVIHFVNLTGGSTSSASFSTPGLSGLVSKMSKASSSCPSSSGPSSVPRLSGMSSVGSVLSGHYLKNNFSPHGREPLTCLNTMDCGLRKIGIGVVLNCLNCFLGKKKYSLCRYEYGVSRSTFEMEARGGTCTTADSGSPEEVIHRAIYLLDNGFGNYDLEKHNCEDFALYCKTGLLVPNKSAPGMSGQVNFALGLASFSSTEETRKGKITTNGSKMYFRDIGVRNDVKRVAAENVAAFLKRRDGPA